MATLDAARNALGVREALPAPARTRAGRDHGRRRELFNRYDVPGTFVDTTIGDAAYVAFYAAIRSQKPGAIVVMNAACWGGDLSCGFLGGGPLDGIPGDWSRD